jgi:N-acetylglutamate synthase-like GNAT family acetyltransferase
MSTELFQEQKKGFTITTDKSKLDVNSIFDYLSNRSYWAMGVPLEKVKRAIENSICYGVYDSSGKQAGFARVVTDKATIAYIGDLFILEEYRKQGLSKWLMECILKHPELQGFRRWILLTKDAHGLYKQYGFNEPEEPSTYMELRKKDVYKNR